MKSLRFALKAAVRGCPRLPRPTNNGLVAPRRHDVARTPALFSSDKGGTSRAMGN